MSTDTIKKKVKAILCLSEKAEKAKIIAGNISAQVDKKVKEIRKKIQSGKETTGDEISDFVIVHHNFLNPMTEAIYRKLQKRVREHKDEFVLVVVRSRERKNSIYHETIVFGPRQENYIVVLKEYLFLGVINGDSLVLDLAKGNCQFPTGRYAQCWDPFCEKEVELVKENLASFWLQYLATDLGRPLEGNSSLDPIAALTLMMINKKSAESGPESKLAKLEIRVGDAEVREWFKKQPDKGRLLIFEEMAELLGRPITGFPELDQELQRRRKVVAKRFAEFAKERDQIKGKIKSPPELQEIEERINEQIELARELGMTDEEIQKLVGDTR